MHIVEVSQAGKKAPHLEVEAISQRGGLHEGIFYATASFGRQRDSGDPLELRVDAGAEAQLGFFQAETSAVAVVVGRHGKTGAGYCRVLIKLSIGAGDDK